MKRGKEKQNKRKKTNGRKLLFQVGFCLILLYVGYSLICQEIEIDGKKRELQGLDTQIAAQQEKQTELEHKKQQASTPEYMEQIARHDLGYVMPDETVFVDGVEN